MKFISSNLLFFIVLIAPFFLQAQDDPKFTTDLFVQDSLKLISSDFSFTEGCSTDKNGNVFFTDQPNDKIWKYAVDGKLSVFLEKSGRANGTYFDRKGNLITCADEHGALWSINPKGKVKVLMSDFKGKQFNGPNDLWIDLNGTIYFTDPYYQRDYWKRTKPDLENDNVYLFSKSSKELRVVADSLVKPNGIVGTPDGKYLYVSDINAGKTYRYLILKNGDLTEKKLLINKGSDGMTLDERGNIYITNRLGVLIYSQEGTMLAQVKVPEEPSNVCFGGKNKDLLFITARKSIFILPMHVKGVE